jgi:CheY-like chemotaxis protein
MATTSAERIPLHEILHELSQELRSGLPAEIRLRRQIEARGYVARGGTVELRAACRSLVESVVGELIPGGGALEITLIAVDVDDPAFAERRGLKTGMHARLGVRAVAADPDNDQRDFVGATPELVANPTVLRVAEQLAPHGARMRIHCVAEKLCVYHAYFPVSQQGATDEDHLRRGCGTVLFVDDDDALVDIHRRSIESLGYEVIECTQATRAFDLIQRYPDEFDVVISDLGMPDMRGDELARRIRAVSPQMPIGLSTGLAVASGEAGSADGDFEILLAKPFSLEELADALNLLRKGRRGARSDESTG